MYCIHCGEKRIGAGSYCAKCGQSFPEPDPAAEDRVVPTVDIRDRHHNSHENLDNTEQSSSPVYFPVAPKKLFLMATTVPFYGLYWFFRNWRFLKVAMGHKILPFWRAWFSFIYCYPLFKNVKKHADDDGIETKWSPKGSYLTYVFFFVILGKFLWPVLRFWARLMQSQGVQEVPPLMPIIFGVAIYTPIISTLAIVSLVLLRVQETINQLNHNQKDVAIDKRISWLNILGIVLGVYFWILYYEDIVLAQSLIGR